MKCTHKAGNTKISGISSDLFLLSNRSGGYVFLGDDSFSHYTGVTFFHPTQWTLCKTIDNISLEKQPTELVNEYFKVTRKSDETSEEFFTSEKTLYYRVQNYDGYGFLDVDMRRIYDDDTTGRIYQIYQEDGALVIDYRKYRTDACHDEQERFLLVIRGFGEYEILDQWLPRSYPYDADRGNMGERWVYRALRFKVEGSLHFSCTFGVDKKEALHESWLASDAFSMTHDRLDYLSRRTCSQAQSANEPSVLLSSSVLALDSLVHSLPDPIDRSGIFAGFPWFFHFWARDELIALQGLVHARNFVLVKDILFRYVDQIQGDGRLPNMQPASDLGSADAVGWLWKRFGDVVRSLQHSQELWDFFSKEELAGACDILESSLSNLIASHIFGGLVQNKPLETWMDTHGWTGDVREGARIEVQCLTLASFDTLFLFHEILGREHRDLYAFFQTFAQQVRSSFLVDGVLADGVVDNRPDMTLRPNIFLAAYLYPALLQPLDWEKTFDAVIDACWLPWGGFSSIDKNDALFTPEYSGQNNRSYHRGDSWFWVNNLAAFALHSVNEEKYASYVNKILQSSVSECLWEGIVGHAAEVSSASHRTSSGCFAQAWSASTLVELACLIKNVDERIKKD